MRTHNLLLFLLLVLPLMAVKPSLAEEHAIYLVLMDGEPVAFKQGLTPSKHQNQFKPQSEYSEEYKKFLVNSHNELLQSKLQVGTYRKLYSFYHIVNGFAIHTTPSQVKRLESAPGVLLIERDGGAKLMTTYTPQFLGIPERVWTQEDGTRNAGEGIVIGVIDTGIDPTHPSFAYEPFYQNGTQNETRFAEGPCELGPRFPAGSCNGKIVSARYFSAGAEAVLGLNTSVDLTPFDEIGHGSHVASIAAGNWGVPVVVDGFMYGFASGMAPRAKLAIYKAMYPKGGTMADIVSAIEQATRDGVDIITLSVGPARPPAGVVTFMNVFDIFLLFARRAGIFVAQAAGNRGPGVATVVSFSPWAMGVAAGTTGRSYTPTLVLSDGRQLPGVGLSAPTPGNGLFQFKLVSAKDAAIVNRTSSNTTTLYAEECQHPDALQPELVLNSVVICSFSQGFFNGTSNVTAILDTAAALGFIGFVLVANPLYGDFIAQPLPLPIPGIMIPGVVLAQTLMDYYERHTYRDIRGTAISYSGTAAIREGRVANFSDQAPIVSRFSSRGPDIIDNQMNPAEVLKPDILAPGQQIWGAWSPTSMLDPILSGNNFALLSGTSMATPHVTGIAALIKQFHPCWTPSMIASAMSTTATKHDNRGQPIMSEGPELYTLYPSTPFDHGAGLINPSAALDPGLVLPADFEDYVRFLCSLRKVSPEDVRLATGMTCNISLNTPADLNLPSITITIARGTQSVRRTVKNVAGKPETYVISILPPDIVEVSVEPRWFNIASEGTQSLTLRFNKTRASDTSSFGEVILTGSLNHIVRVPLVILPMAVH